MTVDEFVQRFKYTPDKRGSWDILDPHDQEPKGDCEDFALTVAWILAGESWLGLVMDMLLFRSVVWLGRADNGEPHAFLWRRGEGWIDNIHPEWHNRTPHTKWLPAVFPLPFLFMLVL